MIQKRSRLRSYNKVYMATSCKGMIALNINASGSHIATPCCRRKEGVSKTPCATKAPRASWPKAL